MLLHKLRQSHIHTGNQRHAHRHTRGVDTHKLSHFFFQSLFLLTLLTAPRVPFLLNWRLNLEVWSSQAVPLPVATHCAPHHRCLSSCGSGFLLGGISINLNCKGPRWEKRESSAGEENKHSGMSHESTGPDMSPELTRRLWLNQAPWLTA